MMKQTLLFLCLSSSLLTCAMQLNSSEPQWNHVPPYQRKNIILKQAMQSVVIHDYYLKECKKESRNQQMRKIAPKKQWLNLSSQIS